MNRALCKNSLFEMFRTFSFPVFAKSRRKIFVSEENFLTVSATQEPYDPDAERVTLERLELSGIASINLTNSIEGHLNRSKLEKPQLEKIQKPILSSKGKSLKELSVRNSTNETTRTTHVMSSNYSIKVAEVAFIVGLVVFWVFFAFGCMFLHKRIHQRIPGVFNHG